MPDNNIFTLAKLLGAKNITDSTFAKSPAGMAYVAQQNQSNNADELLRNATTPVGAIGASINSYLQAKNQKKVLGELSAELQSEAVAKEEKRSVLANLFPEDQREIAQTLDLETLQNLAEKRLQPTDPNTGLDRQYKMAQINRLNRDGTGYSDRPLPVQALKLQNEELDTVGTLGGINADLKNIENQIDSGQLELGPIKNIVSEARNYFGKSTPNSRNYSSFQSTLEKLRNDSLRLNKGVQTEGDAQRAWNELLKHINDPDLVKKRLAEIQVIDERGADLKRLNIDQIRANYGKEPLDYSQYNNRPAAIGANNGNSGGGFKILNVRNQ